MEFHYKIRPGRYRHFKGGEYEVLGMAHHSETEEELVVYRTLYGDHDLWVRPAAMWCETVERDAESNPALPTSGSERMKIVDRFGSRPGAELVRLPQGGERLLAVEHAAALLVNEQTAFRVVCTPELLPQLALGRLLTEGWIASADEVEQVAVCAEGLKVSVHLTHPLAAAPAAGQEVPSCCTDNLTVASPVVLRQLAPVPQLDVPEAWVGTLAAAMGGELPLYRATRAVHSCFLLRAGRILYQCEDLGRHNALDKAVGCALADGVPLGECVLYTSGRVPVDMVRKAIRAGVPALVSKTMPTVQSVELAEEYGLRLLIQKKNEFHARIS